MGSYKLIIGDDMTFVHVTELKYDLTFQEDGVLDELKMVTF